MAEKPAVAVALSGGVDSAVAAALLVRQGWQVLGVHLRLSEAGAPGKQLTALAHSLGISLIELDLRREFTARVVKYFVSEYSRGHTPNPCVQCNAAIKFGYLWEHLRSQGVSYLATGHYVRLKPDAQGTLGLYRGRDRTKDQSYFLCRLPRQLLPHLIFPLGEMTKKEVRTRYHDLGLPSAPSCRESQEICFLEGQPYQEFLRSYRGGRGQAGDLVDRQGRVLGRHRGIIGYTVGQRRGLGVPAREPYYVLEIQPETHRVVIGPKAELYSVGLLAHQVNWLIDPPSKELEARAVIRYRHPGVSARLIPLGPTEIKAVFATPQAAVAPGQAVAFYLNDQLLGGGWIERRLAG
ncbi:MAG: tRNA 2-thiouridine(34) synthase MnmA [Thermodesulfobacteriota bacterium]